MKLENTIVQMRKGILEFCVLYVISEKEVYTSDLISKLKDAKMMVVEGTLYPLLTRLKNAEVLEYNWVESQSGPPRKYYKLTSKGKKFLKELNHTWSEISDSVITITQK